MPAVHISGEVNLTYVQVPKTAGTSVGHWLIENSKNSQCTEWYPHITLAEINKTHPKNFSFTIVRNPWDRMVSLYFFLKNFNPPHKDYRDQTEFKQWLYDLNGFKEFPSFSEWLNTRSNFKLLPWIWWTIDTPQTAWANDVDLIIKYENLETEFKAIQDIVNCYTPLPKQTVTKGIHWHDYKDIYSDETKKIVADAFAEEIDLWKYTF